MPPLIRSEDSESQKNKQEAIKAFEQNRAKHLIEKHLSHFEKIVNELIESYRKNYQNSVRDRNGEIWGSVKKSSGNKDIVFTLAQVLGGVPMPPYEKAICDHIARRIAEKTEDDPSRIQVSYYYYYYSGGATDSSAPSSSGSEQENTFYLKYVDM